jgi:hypothetical protein
LPPLRRINSRAGAEEVRFRCALGGDEWRGWSGPGRCGWSDVAGGRAAQAGEDLGEELVGGSGIVGQEDGAGSGLCADVFEGVEVLGEKDEGHDVFGGGSGDGFAEVLDGGAEAVDDGLTLGGDALALKGFGLGFGFGLFDFEDLADFTLTSGMMSVTSALRMLKPKLDMVLSSSVLTAMEMPDCCSKVSSRLSLGTWPRMELKTKDSICFCGALSL